ncbi:leucine-rich repeat-containing protein 46-like [Ptychodera flava]|uniref:leucine-rich repeat-containing protein 46-like n=1 Tax=Ptychodera flava TaxID=63121 RepID=UPI00396A4EB2
MEYDQYNERADGSAETLKMKKSTRISAALIARRNLPPGVVDGTQDALIESLMKITHVRLDREGISEIDNLEMLGPVTNLYLQCNNIRRIENMESLHHLRFLTLAGNQIRRVENLTNVAELKFLDLSENKIDDFDPGELPQQLIILNMKENPCTQLPGYRRRIIQSLLKLQQLDGVNVTKHERRDAGCLVSDSEGEEDDSEEETVLDDGDWEAGLDKERTKHRDDDTIEDVFRVSTKLIQESRARLQRYQADHQIREDELQEIRSQSLINNDIFSPRQTNANLSRVSFDSDNGTPAPR